MNDDLRGSLLIAAPSLFDYFRRTVVLVLEHTDQGAMGLVLNRASTARIEDVVPALSGLAGEEDLVRVGGPVAPQTVVALGDFEDGSEAGSVIVDSLGVVDPDRPPATLRDVRVYAGHAAWAPGQLEGELEQGAWIVEPADPADPFRDQDLWSSALRRKGGAYTLLATMPVDPSVN